MKILVTGANGQLGRDLVKRLHQLNVPCIPADVELFDITDAKAVADAVTAIAPDAIIHCAAYTAVDKAETEPANCCRINAVGTLNLVRAAVSVGAKLCYISTDYVFPGTGDRPWAVNDRPGPLNIYGMSKLQGEEAVRSLMRRCFIVRTSWVYGLGGKNFVRTMLRLGRERASVRVVNDQIGSPTYTVDLAEFLCSLIATEKYGVYHATNEGFCSWAEFTQRIFALSGLPCRVEGIPTSEYPTLARRPLNSRMGKEAIDRAGLQRLPAWEDALARFLDELRANGEL